MKPAFCPPCPQKMAGILYTYANLTGNFSTSILSAKFLFDLLKHWVKKATDMSILMLVLCSISAYIDVNIGTDNRVYGNDGIKFVEKVVLYCKYFK